jgi:CTP:molybdopterin cytidylyltransferase MocA
VAVLVLAAGRGVRFGRPKALAEVSPGVRFLDVIVRTANTAGASRILAIVPAGVSAPDGAVTVINEHGAGEPIESVRLGLLALDAEVVGALLWPVDHPFVMVETVRGLLHAIRETAAPAVVPVHYHRRGHPVYFARSAWPALRTVEDGGARNVLHSLGSEVVDVPVQDPGILADVNTPHDLALWAGSAAERVPGP